jgi:hypothetical protein
MKTLRNIFMALAILIGWLATAQEVQEPLEQQDEQPVPERDPKAKEKIEAARIGMITNKLGLTPEQAEKFWPIYREFSDKRMALRREFKGEQEKLKPGTATPEDQKKLVDLGLDLKQREVDLEKNYSGRLLKIITPEQMLNLRSAERDFQRMIIQQLQQRRNIQQRRENFRDKNQNLRQRRN